MDVVVRGCQQVVSIAKERDLNWLSDEMWPANPPILPSERHGHTRFFRIAREPNRQLNTIQENLSSCQIKHASPRTNTIRRLIGRAIRWKIRCFFQKLKRTANVP